MTDLAQLVLDILDKGYLLSLATHDSGGVWVSDVIYVHDGVQIYWISETDTRHSQAISGNAQVAGTITISNGPGPNIGLQISGTARKIQGDLDAMAAQHRRKRGKSPPARGEQFLDEGESWYCLIPDTIEVIYEPKFGFDKQILKFPAGRI